MGFQISVSIGYKDIFDDFDTTDFDSLVSDIPTKNSLQIVGYFMAQLHTLERDPKLQIEFLKMWMGRLPEPIHKNVNSFIQKINKNPKNEYTFLDNVSLLILTERLLERENNLKQLTNLTPEQELNLFEAYLLCSQ